MLTTPRAVEALNGTLRSARRQKLVLHPLNRHRCETDIRVDHARRRTSHDATRQVSSRHSPRRMKLWFCEITIYTFHERIPRRLVILSSPMIQCDDTTRFSMPPTRPDSPLLKSSIIRSNSAILLRSRTTVALLRWYCWRASAWEQLA